MKYRSTPEEAQPVADAVAAYFRRLRFDVYYEMPLEKNAPYCTTLLAKRRELRCLVEAQGNLSYGRAIQSLALWLAANNKYAELYLATGSESDTQAGLLTGLEKDGVGLIVVDNNKSVSIFRRAINHALVVTPDPTLKYGDYKQEVQNAVTKFNTVDRKDGLRDICELVEGVTDKLALKAVRRGCLKIGEHSIEKKDWFNKINILASQTAYKSGYSPIVSDTLKTDLHSFRGARNLVDHNVRTKRDEDKRQRQFAERMMMGPRLVAELVSLIRKIQ